MYAMAKLTWCIHWRACTTPSCEQQWHYCSYLSHINES